MESRIKLLGHALHQMMVPLPLGMLLAAVGFDLLGLLGRGRDWHLAADRLLASTLLVGPIVAAPGLVDWAAIPDGTRAKSIGRLHGLGNAGMLLLFALSWGLRRKAPAEPGTGPVLLGLLGAGLALVTSWLGGELVGRHGIGVDRGAHPDAPASLSGRPASAR